MKKIISAIISVLLCFNINAVCFAEDDIINCLDETFSEYTENGLPCEWKNYDENGDADGNGLVSGTGKSDQALQITNTTEIHGTFKELTNKIMLGRTFCVEFDLYSTAQSGFYMSILDNEAMQEANSAEQYVSNAVIGMHTKQATGSTGVSKTPALGYTSGSNGALVSFDAANCKITTGAWNHIKLTVAPVSETKTNLTISIDGRTEYYAESPLNFSTRQAAGIAFSSGKLARTSANQYVAFDNISVYTFNSPPQVTAVSFWMDGEKQNGSISEMTDKIEVDLDIRAEFSNINKSVALVEKNTSETLKYNVSLDEDGKKIIILLEESMTAGETYVLKVSDGYLPWSETIVMDDYETEFSVVSDEFEVLEIKSYIGDEEVDRISTVTETIKIFLTNKINTENLAEKVYIEDERGNRVNNIVPVTSNGKDIEIGILGMLEGEKIYILKINNIENAAFDTITTSYEYPFNVDNEVIHVENVKFADLTGTEITDMSDVPYTLYSIVATFDQPISEKDIQNKIFLKCGEDKTPAGYRISADSKEVAIILDQNTLEKGKQYTYVISSEVSHKGNSNVLIDSQKQVDFTVSSELVYDTKIYFMEDFNDFNGNGNTLPSGWHTVFYDVLKGGTYPEAGSSGQADDKSWRLGHNTIDARVLKAMNNGEMIPKGVPFIAEWDVNMMDDEQEMRLSVLSEIDLEYHYSTGEGPYVYYENTTLGFFYNKSVGYTTVSYPNIARTSNSFTEFKDNSLKPGDEDYYLKMPKSGWHNIKLEIIPKSEKLTILNISIDGGKTYTAETPLDFYTFQPAGVCVWPFLGSQAMFDNIKVYTAQPIREPQVSNIVLNDYLSKEYNTTDVIPATTSAIKVTFDTAINAENISDYIKLYCGNDIVDCDYETDVLGQYVVVKPSEFLKENSTYRIVVLPGINMKLDNRFTSQSEIEEYFRTGEGNLLDIYNESLEIGSDTAVYNFSMVQYDNPAKDYIVIMADYTDEIINVNGVEKTYKKLKKIQNTAFSLNENKIKDMSVDFKCSENSDYVCGYIISTEDNTVLAGMLKSR